MRFKGNYLCLFLAASAFGSSSCSDKPSEEQCTKLTKHISNLVAKQKGNEAIGSGDTLFEMLDEGAANYCQQEISKKRVVCALEADTIETARKCDD